MALAAGTRLGVYEIVDALGAGGMGEVYRGRDTRLGREVAIKVLLAELAADADRIARFEREARTLAALNHPHIAQLYGLEHIPAQEPSLPDHFLVMELVDGETLGDLIARGRMPIAQALAVALQIANALEAAHEKGIVHRDLKPANVKITSDGAVKVLDFGLAKALDEANATTVGPRGGLTHSPTLSLMATQAGIILGTAAYMSPEQAKGLPADQRSDIFSFGVVLYEMLTARQPFPGDTAPEVLASVLIRDADLTVLSPDLNPRLVDLVKRCLHKNPKQRWQHVGDVRAELETIAANPHLDAAAASSVRPRPMRVIPLAATAVVAAALGGVAAWTMKPAPHGIVTRFAVPLGEGQQFTNLGRQVLAISRDGTKIVYVANQRLFLRAIGDVEARPIAGSDATGAVLHPVFAPDGASIAYWSTADQALKRIPITGGVPVTIARAAAPFGMSWSGDYLIFGQPNLGVVRVPAAGGTLETIAKTAPNEFAHGPQLVDDRVVFTVTTGTTADRWERATVVVESLTSHQRIEVVRAASDARYLPGGYLVYAVGGVLLAAPFDPRRPAPIQQGTPIVEGVRRAGGATGTAHFAVSDTGTLVYVSGPALLTVGRSDVAIGKLEGRVAALQLPPASYQVPRISPDGKRLAVGTEDAGERAIWVYDLAGTSSIRKLTLSGKDGTPLWSADGQRVIFQSARDGDAAVFWQRADGTGTAERLTTPERGVAHVPEAASPDGRYMLIGRLENGSHSLLLYSFADRKIASFGTMSSIYPLAAAFSPDGRWITYMKPNLTSSAVRVYVEPFPPNGTTYDVGVGIHPLWSRDGKRLYFQPGQGRSARVPVVTQPAFSFGAQEVLQRQTIEPGPTVPRPYDLMADDRIVGIVPGTDADSIVPSRMNVVLSWFEELKQRVPGR
jgi:serine/threonine-protein kinase